MKKVVLSIALLLVTLAGVVSAFANGPAPMPTYCQTHRCFVSGK